MQERKTHSVQKRFPQSQRELPYYSGAGSPRSCVGRWLYMISQSRLGSEEISESQHRQGISDDDAEG